MLIYGISLILMFAGSAAYHQSAGKSRRSLLRKFDHAAIYQLIAGTYTPLMLCENMGKLALIVLCIIWFLALLGILTELFSWKIFPKMSLVLYLAMGWLCLMVFPALWRELSAQSLSFLV